MTDRAVREERHFFRRVLLMSAGLIVWAAHFTVIYGLNTLACTRAFAGVHVLGFGLVPVVVIVLTIAALAACIAILYVSAAGRGTGDGGSEEARFLRYITVTVAALSLIAIAWNGLPALLLSPCA
jgi:heme/copper-type cytochrome/quinol oxidase subunit 2